MKILIFVLCWLIFTAAKPLPPLTQIDPFTIDTPLTDHLSPLSWQNVSKRQRRLWKKFSKKKLRQNVGQFGDRQVRSKDLQDALFAFDQILKTYSNPRFLDQAIRQKFDFYQMVGKTGKGDVLVTGYYHPLIRGSLKKTQTFRYPLYRLPPDLVKIKLSKFPGFENQKKTLLGRLSKRGRISQIQPYFSHQEIEEGQKLAHRNLELAWVASPLDRFFLQIQGSGSIVLPNGKKLPVYYAGANGHRYISIGRELIQNGYLGRKELSMQSIRDLLSFDKELMDEYLYMNPSYVFFEKGHGKPKGSSGAELTALRSLAADRTIFPAGALVWMEYNRPVFDEQGKIQDWTASRAYMIIQDSGGAIRGPGRLDFYQGAGHQAVETAGHMAHFSKAYILLLRD